MVDLADAGPEAARGGPTPAAPTVDGAGGLVAWDGQSAREWAARLGVPRVVLYGEVTSTMDAAHALAAAGAPAGTLVLAERQTAGRGRAGRTWVARRGAGIWMTLVERPLDGSTVEIWALRFGVWAARALDAWADRPVSLKWPNDLYIGPRKIGGILVEARWQDQRIQWAAVGIGLNVHDPVDVAGAGALRPGTSRAAVLEGLVPAVRSAAGIVGPLTEDELCEFAGRDLARGRSCREPAAGRVEGISSSGDLLVATPDGVRPYHTGSLVFDGEQGGS
jgi:BirA family biotin operon repressor/biotin-[acetyl-CoA-carboxylase] ligase